MCVCYQAVNENSLQILSSFLESLQQNRPQNPTTVKFFLRPQGTITDKGKIKYCVLKFILTSCSRFSS